MTDNILKKHVERTEKELACLSLKIRDKHVSTGTLTGRDESVRL